MTYGHSLVRACTLSILAVAAPAEPAQSGAVTGESHLAPASIRDGSVAHTLMNGGPAWSFASGNEGWVPSVISLGDRGTEVFSEVGPFSAFTRIFSSYDIDPPSPIWQSLSPVPAFHLSIDSAETCDIHAALYDTYSDSTLTTRTVYVRRCSAATPQYNWTYTYPFVTAGDDSLAVRISRDGSRIVSAVLNAWTGMTYVAVFASNSNTPIAYFPVALPGGLNAMLLSGDGNRLYLASVGRIMVIEIPSGATSYTGLPIDSLFPGAHGLSHDGSTFAYGTYGAVKVFKRSPVTGAYSLAFVHAVPGQNYCDRLAISNDGSTLAAAFEFWDHFLSVQIDAVDLETCATTMSNTVTGIGTYANVASSISMSLNGQRFAVGLWGDQAGTVPQVEFYARDQSAPIGAFSLPGSVMALSMSGDGEHVAVASKSVHANVSGQGGSITLYQVGAVDLRMQGVPHAGENVSFQLSGTPGAHARLLYAPNAASQPTVFPGVGTLYLDRPTTLSQPLGTVGLNGLAQSSFALPSTVGTTWYFQGFSTAPRTLSDDWLAVTLLP
jgi:hypothetical protein